MNTETKREETIAEKKRRMTTDDGFGRRDPVGGA
jgi:hypothetical protein